MSENEGIVADTLIETPAVTSEAVATHEVATPEVQATPGFIDMARERGYRFESESEALDAIERLATNLNQLAPYADFGKQAVPRWNEFEEWSKQRAAQEQAAQAPAQKPSAWAPPQLSQIELDTYFTKDHATGRYTAKSGNIPPEVAKKAAEWDAYTGRHLYHFRTNPIESLAQLGYARKDEVLEEVKNWYKSEQEKAQQEYQKVQFERLKQDTFESLKPLVIDSRTGKLNAYGARFTEVVTELESNGITNPRQVADMAKKLVDAEILLSKQGNAATDATIRAAAGMPVTPGGPAAGNIPNRVPPQTRPEVPAPTNMSFTQLLKQTDPGFDFDAMRKELLGF